MVGINFPQPSGEFDESRMGMPVTVYMGASGSGQIEKKGEWIKLIHESYHLTFNLFLSQCRSSVVTGDRRCAVVFASECGFGRMRGGGKGDIICG